VDIEMHSGTSEYARRAVVCLLGHAEECPMVGKRIADETGIPHKYLSNIGNSHARAGVPTSAPGIGGGFAMARWPSEVVLDEILKPFESILGPSRPCPLGNEVCSDDDPCAGYESWKHVKEVYAQFLRDTSIHEVSIKRGVRFGSRKRKR
jgi:Rrf2 family protein